MTIWCKKCNYIAVHLNLNRNMYPAPQTTGTETTELLYYNAITSLPGLLVIFTFTGESKVLAGSSYAGIAELGFFGFTFLVFLCSIMGVLLNYSLFLCTMHNTALTTTIVGVLKGVVTVTLGFFLLGGVRFSWMNFIGICMNMAGGIWYTYIKYVQHQHKQLVSGSDSGSTSGIAATPSMGALYDMVNSGGGPLAGRKHTGVPA